MRGALDFLEKNHKFYYVIYRVMLESGARVSHVFRLLEAWRPDERIEVPSIDLVTDRLVVFEDRGVCRHYLGLGDAAKKCEWIYISFNVLELVKSVAPRRIAEICGQARLDQTEVHQEGLLEADDQMLGEGGS